MNVKRKFEDAQKILEIVVEPIQEENHGSAFADRRPNVKFKTMQRESWCSVAKRKMVSQTISNVRHGPGLISSCLTIFDVELTYS